jgi:hypothetical protein
MFKNTCLLIIVAFMLFQYSRSVDITAPPYTYPDWVESPATAACLAYDSTSEIVPEPSSIVTFTDDYVYYGRSKIYD